MLLGAATFAVAAPLPARLALAATGSRSSPLPAGPRRLELRHATTDARFSGPYFDGTAHDPVALAEISAVLADTRSGAVRDFDPETLDLLWEVAQRTRLKGEIPILSGYRTPATNRAVHGAGDSFHLRAAALDVEVAPSRLGRFAETALRLKRGGVGIYARRGFVHIDSGPVRSWDMGDGVPGAKAAPRDRVSRMAEAWATARPKR
jgi:uncharacterized protein YcbK (DUF882 family)